MRLAYKELEIDRKMEEKKLRNLEGTRKEQAERLGMGLGSRRYLIKISGSAEHPNQEGTDLLKVTFTVASVCFLLQLRVSLCDGRDAADRAGNPRRGQVVLALQTGPVRRAGLHLRTPKVREGPSAVWAERRGR